MNRYQQNTIRIQYTLPGILLFVILFSCKDQGKEKEQVIERKQIASSVTAVAETAPVHSVLGEDAADDPAIWINRDDPSKSVIIGTNKKAGLSVYNLSGEEIHFFQVGLVNNVDLRYDFELGNGEKVDLIAGSDGTDNKIQVFKINPEDYSLENISNARLMSEHGEVYGFCMYHSMKDNSHYAIVNHKEGYVDQWKLLPFEDDKITGELVRTLTIASQPEGMVADDELGFLYVGEEDKGIWKYNAEPDGEIQPQFIAESDTSNSQIAYDIEGLSIYYASNGRGYLIASSQGNYSYAIFEREKDNKYLGSFSIVDDIIDGTDETDGLDVTNINLGSPYSSGMFIVQDGFNFDGEVPKSQNFKMVNWRQIAELFEPPLLIDSSYMVESW